MFIESSVFCVSQGKEYVFVANSDNLGAIVDLSMSSLYFFSFLFTHSFIWLIRYFYMKFPY
jgi:hypothetical protein